MFVSSDVLLGEILERTHLEGMKESVGEDAHCENQGSFGILGEDHRGGVIGRHWEVVVMKYVVTDNVQDVMGNIFHVGVRVV